MKTYQNPDIATQEQLTRRPQLDTTKLCKTIKEVFDNVQQRGDEALIGYTERYDGISLGYITVTAAEITAASDQLPEALRSSISLAYDNIRQFHLSQQMDTVRIETSRGVTCWRESRAIDRVGLYIPGGSAPLFSTVLMLGVPAQIAGCSEVVLCTPPLKDGSVHPAILYAAELCGITTIHCIGGAQAIAAMVFGTESITPVYKLFGPGNQYVTAAKQLALSYGVAIDMPAGPSEVLVYADHGANPAFVASDLLSQAEHGPDSQVVLVTTDSDLVSQVVEALCEQSAQLPRAAIVEQSLSHSYAVVFEDLEQVFSFINAYAPEHLIIASDDAERYISKVQNAGSVFLGHLTPESVGDYASGTNHTLPTAGYARTYSGVSLDSFVKKITFQQLTSEGIESIGPDVIKMARAEQLDAHAQAVQLRLDSLSK